MKNMEFEGRTEREAVARAAAELGSESFDVEVIEETGGLFSRGKVKIRVRTLSEIPNPLKQETSQKRKSRQKPPQEKEVAQKNYDIPTEPPKKEILKKTADFMEGVIEKMGFSGTMNYSKTDENKLVFEIISEDSNRIIGKHGKNLDALQVLANSFFIRIDDTVEGWRILLDIEGYRQKQMDALTRMANRMADEAVKTGSSRLLEAMNPYERRLVHTAINQRQDATTRSEGEGLYKRIRILPKNGGQNRSKYHR